MKAKENPLAGVARGFRVYVLLMDRLNDLPTSRTGLFLVVLVLVFIEAFQFLAVFLVFIEAFQTC